MPNIKATCDTCKQTVEAKTVLGENELWQALNKGDEIEAFHLDEDKNHTWKLTGQDKDNLKKQKP
jgi:hypothetical protein